jgi:hypothetical protein
MTVLSTNPPVLVGTFFVRNDEGYENVIGMVTKTYKESARSGFVVEGVSLGFDSEVSAAELVDSLQKLALRMKMQVCDASTVPYLRRRIDKFRTVTYALVPIETALKRLAKAIAKRKVESAKQEAAIAARKAKVSSWWIEFGMLWWSDVVTSVAVGSLFLYSYSKDDERVVLSLKTRPHYVLARIDRYRQDEDEITSSHNTESADDLPTLLFNIYYKGAV